VWIVGECDTLHRISELTGIPFAVLVAANPQIADPNIIFPGQVINLPR
jgi:nucleoid-associated protein YgaU